jgi:hypothetical protein
MAAVNRKTAKRLLETAEKQLGRELTFGEFAKLLKGDCSVLSKKNRSQEVKE